MMSDERKIRVYLMNIQVAQNEYRTTVTKLAGYCLLLHEYYREEEIYNLILDIVKDKRLKTKIRNIIKKESKRILFPTVTTDKEGYIEFITGNLTTKESVINKKIKAGEGESGRRRIFSYDNLLQFISIQAFARMREVKTMVAVVEDFIKNNNRIRVYEDMLTHYKNDINSTCYVPLPMFSHEIYIKSLGKQSLFENLEDYQNPLSNPNTKPGFKYWALFPEYEKIEIDQVFIKSEYNEFFEDNK